MFKRITVGILSAVIVACTLCGCSLFTHDSERDLRQEVARVKSYTIQNMVEVEEEVPVLDENNVPKTDPDGNPITVKETVKKQAEPYVTEEKIIYKQDLLEYVNSNASSLSQSFGDDYEALYKYGVDMLVNMELVTNEVDALIDCGNIEWGQEQWNAIRKNIYSVIDNTILNLKNTILAERDQEQIVGDDSSSSDSTSTTYPVKEETKDEDDDDLIKEPVEPWSPDKSRYPGLTGDSDERSLGREAVRRFIALLKTRTQDDFRLTGAQKERIENEFREIDNIINTEGYEYVYRELGTYPIVTVKEDGSKEYTKFGHIMYYLSGENIERSQKISALQTYLTDQVTVSDDEVAAAYTALLNSQKAEYTENVSAFDTAMSGSSTTVLYYPNNNYFYVKHILLPFSDEQKAALTAFGNRSDIKSLSEKEQKQAKEEERARLAEAIVCYPHVDGEDDLTRPMSVDEVLAHVKSVMLPLKADPSAASAAYDDLIYLYNTDPGAFGNSKGYVVKYKLGEGESETYMQEFADASRYMRDNLAPGEVYYEKVITDYGVHIMYFASVTGAGEVGLYDYTDSTKKQTYFDLLKQPIHSARESAAYTKWENNVLSYNYGKYSDIYTDNFSNLWEG